MKRFRPVKQVECVVTESRMGKDRITLRGENGDSIRTLLAKAGYRAGDRVKLVPASRDETEA